MNGLACVHVRGRSRGDKSFFANQFGMRFVAPIVDLVIGAEPHKSVR